MRHITKVRIFIIAWVLSIVAAFYFYYTEFSVGALVAFIHGYAIKDLYCQLERYANKPWS